VLALPVGERIELRGEIDRTLSRQAGRLSSTGEFGFVAGGAFELADSRLASGDLGGIGGRGCRAGGYRRERVVAYAPRAR
jgi:hypothetical protein